MTSRMGTGIKKNSIYFLVVLILSFISCNSNSVFEMYTSLPNNIWNQKEPIHFEFAVTDTISRNNLYINLRNNKEYAYNNLYIITQLNFPDGKIIVDTLQYEMADARGKFLGAGISEIKESKLFYKENVRFPVSGDFSVDISQAMRKNGETSGIETLEGITDVGFSIEKIDKE